MCVDICRHPQKQLDAMNVLADHNTITSKHWCHVSEFVTLVRLSVIACRHLSSHWITSTTYSLKTVVFLSTGVHYSVAGWKILYDLIFICVVKLLKYLLGRLRGLALACWTTNRYHSCSNLGGGHQEVVSSLTSLHHLCRSLGPFSLLFVQKLS